HHLCRAEVTFTANDAMIGERIQKWRMHVSSRMNKEQELPWDSPRFRNWVAVARACHAVERAAAAALAPLDLKPAQLDVLMNLYHHPGMSQHDLARKLLVGRSNITMLLPQMEKRDLLRRV